MLDMAPFTAFQGDSRWESSRRAISRARTRSSLRFIASGTPAELEVLFAHQALAVGEGGRSQVPQQELATDGSGGLPGTRLERGIEGSVLGSESGFANGAFHDAPPWG